MYTLSHSGKRKLSIKAWKAFTNTFNCMPVAAIVEERIFCIHGGLSPTLTRVQQIATINRPIEIQNTGLLCDLLWADPTAEVSGYVENVERGISYLFGADAVQKFLKTNDMDLICRAHQIVEQGYEFFGKKRDFVTIFSAPNYCGLFQNSGAVLTVDARRVCSFHILKPLTKGNLEEKKKIKKPLKYIT